MTQRVTIQMKAIEVLGGASGSGKYACGMTKSWANPSYGCNCDKNDNV